LSNRKLTWILAVLTITALVVASPNALREAFERGQVYVFTRQFFEDIPARLSGPGRFRFLLQPSLATFLGIRDGRADARSGRSYLATIRSAGGPLRALAQGGLARIANLLLMGILLDTIFQWVIFGVAHPGAAVVLGPVLIAGPYSVARTLASRFTRIKPERTPGRP
jgi:hypothetical protein